MLDICRNGCSNLTNVMNIGSSREYEEKEVRSNRKDYELSLNTTIRRDVIEYLEGLNEMLNEILPES